MASNSKKVTGGTIFSPNPESNLSDVSKKVLRLSYNDFNLILCPISADLLLERWCYDRNEVSSRILPENISSVFEDVFPSDKNCKGCLGEGGTPYVLRNSCIGCQLLTRLFRAGKEGHSKTLTIQTGKEEGKIMYISYIPSSVDSLIGYEESKVSKEYGNKIFNSIDSMLTCEKGFPLRVDTTHTFVTTSKLSNYIVISCMLEAEMKAAEMPSLPIFRWVYECNNGTIMVENHFNKGNLKNILKYSDFCIKNIPSNLDQVKCVLKPDVARLILSQIVMNLAFLSNYDFTHGEPSMNSIVIINEPCSMKYDNIRLESPFTIHLVPTSFSSMTIKSSKGLIRNYCSNGFTPSIADIRLISKIKFMSHLRKSDNHDIEPCSPIRRCTNAKVNPTLIEFKKLRVMSYKIIDGEVFDTYTNNMGIALFPSSFDTYAFFVGLMVEESFRYSILSDTNLNKIWQNLWVDEEYNNIMADINKLSIFYKEKDTTPSYIMIRDVLVKYYLRCDGLYYIWEALKTLSSIV